jgi:hypothetical protein
LELSQGERLDTIPECIVGTKQALAANMGRKGEEEGSATTDHETDNQKFISPLPTPLTILGSNKSKEPTKGDAGSAHPFKKEGMKALHFR